MAALVSGACAHPRLDHGDVPLATKCHVGLSLQARSG